MRHVTRLTPALRSAAILAACCWCVTASSSAVQPLAAAAAADAPRLEYRVIFASELMLERKLASAAREGFACVAVARNESGASVPGVAVILGRPSGTPPPPAAAVSHQVISGGRDSIEAVLERSGAQGFRLCGIALDEERNSRLVAVMTRSARNGAADAVWHYRAEALLRYKDSLARLKTIGHEGFVPVAAAALDDNRVVDMRHWIVITEQPRANAVAHEIAVRSGTGPSGLQRAVNEQSHQGYRINVMWKEGNDYVAMMSRPAVEPYAPLTYVIEDDSLSHVHSLSRAYVADFPYLDRRVIVSDDGQRADNEIVEETLPAMTALGYAEERPLQTIADHIGRNHGYIPAFARVGRAADGKLTLSTVIVKPQ